MGFGDSNRDRGKGEGTRPDFVYTVPMAPQDARLAHQKYLRLSKPPGLVVM